MIAVYIFAVLGVCGTIALIAWACHKIIDAIDTLEYLEKDADLYRTRYWDHEEALNNLMCRIVDLEEREKADAGHPADEG